MSMEKGWSLSNVFLKTRSRTIESSKYLILFSFTITDQVASIDRMLLRFDLWNIVAWSREEDVEICLFVVVINVFDLSLHVSEVSPCVLVSKFTAHRDHDVVAVVKESFFLNIIDKLDWFIGCVEIRSVWVCDQWLVTMTPFWVNIVILTFWIAVVFSWKNACEDLVLVTKVSIWRIPDEIKSWFSFVFLSFVKLWLEIWVNLSKHLGFKTKLGEYTGVGCWVTKCSNIPSNLGHLAKLLLEELMTNHYVV